MQDIDFWARTHEGLVRSHNEDAFLWLDPARTQGRGYLWLVCDGMGGEAGGSLASRTAADQIASVYVAAMRRVEQPHRALEEAMQAANQRLLYLQQQNRELRKMGATVVALAYYEQQLWLASAGDSRAYGWASGGIRQLTNDHTKLEKMIEFGVIDPSEVTPDHPARGVLINVLGRENLNVDTLGDQHFDPDGKSLLICSDGLSNCVTEEQIATALRCLDARDASRFLLAAALPISTDNITLQVVRFAPPVHPKSIQDVAAEFGVDVSTVPDGPLTVNSYDGDSYDALSSQAGAPVTVKKNDGVDRVVKGTMMLSPDAINQAVQDQKTSQAQRTSGPGRKGAGGTMMLSPAAIDAAIQSEKNAHEAPSQDEALRAETSSGGTMLLSPAAIEEALKKQSQHKAQAPQHAATSAGNKRPQASEAREASDPIQKIDHAFSEAPTKQQSVLQNDHIALSLRAGSLDEHEGTNPTDELHDDDDAAVQESRYRTAKKLLPVIMVLALLLFGLLTAYVFLQDGSDDRSADATRDDVAQQENPQADDDLQQAKARGALEDLADQDRQEDAPDYQEATNPRAPDRVHAQDEMPAYRVANGQWDIDAHPVTHQQFRKLAAAVPTVQKASTDAQRASSACATYAATADNDQQPACVSQEEAVAYCTAAGRALPTEAQWREIQRHDADVLAKGTHTMVVGERAPHLAAVAETVQSVSGVYDGFPEILAATDAQRKNGVLPLLWPTGDGLTRVQRSHAAPSDVPTATMFSFRCIDSVDDSADGKTGDASSAAADVAAHQDVGKPSPVVSKSTSSRSTKPATKKASKSSSSAASKPTPPPSDANTDVRTAPSDSEAPINPSIPSRSRIIQEMKERQKGE